LARYAAEPVFNGWSATVSILLTPPARRIYDRADLVGQLLLSGAGAAFEDINAAIEVW